MSCLIPDAESASLAATPQPTADGESASAGGTPAGEEAAGDGGRTPPAAAMVTRAESVETQAAEEWAAAAGDRPEGQLPPLVPAGEQDDIPAILTCPPSPHAAQPRPAAGAAGLPQWYPGLRALGGEEDDGMAATHATLPQLTDQPGPNLGKSSPAHGPQQHAPFVASQAMVSIGSSVDSLPGSPMGSMELDAASAELLAARLRPTAGSPPPGPAATAADDLTAAYMACLSGHLDSEAAAGAYVREATAAEDVLSRAASHAEGFGYRPTSILRTSSRGLSQSGHSHTGRPRFTEEPTEIVVLDSCEYDRRRAQRTASVRASRVAVLARRAAVAAAAAATGVAAAAEAEGDG